MEDRYYYAVSVGIVRFPKEKAERFQAYKILQSVSDIRLSDIDDSGGFERPYYVGGYGLRTEHDDEEFPGGIPEIDVETSMEGKWICFDPTIMDIHIKMLKNLEAVGCKMIYLSLTDEARKMPLIERVPKKYYEDFVFNIEWFKKIME